MAKPYQRLKHCPLSLTPNALLIPVTKLHYTPANIDLFNRIYKYMKKAQGFAKIERTPSGAISNKCGISAKLKRWDFRRSDLWMEITIIESAGMWRIQMSPGKDKETPVLSGRQAFFMFENFIKKFDINMEDYAIDNGEIINKQIEKPLIGLSHGRVYQDRVFYKVNHVDFHNSYPAGLVNTHPEFKKGIEYLYFNRKTKPEYKDLLNYTIGFFHSKFCRYKFAHLAKDAIADSNKRVLELARRIEKAGRTILLYNTDGFWYIGEPYHGEGEGSKLGEWHNDHINCKFRAKSSGAYEFIENEEYFPVLRGFTKLDEVKPRENWEWGDIYQENAVLRAYDFDEEKGIYEL